MVIDKSLIVLRVIVIRQIPLSTAVVVTALLLYPQQFAVCRIVRHNINQCVRQTNIYMLNFEVGGFVTTLKNTVLPQNIVNIKISSNDGLNMLLMEGKHNNDCVV